MYTWIMEIMDSYGYWGIALLIAIENLFPPIPSEVILTFGGFMTTYTSMNVPGVVIASTVGSNIGDILLYLDGRLMSPIKLRSLLGGRLGKALHFNKDDINNSMTWFERQGKSTVFFCRCIPIIRSLISIPAGMSQMKFRIFLPLTIAGSAVWNTLLVGAGAAAGASWEKVLDAMDTYSTIAFLIVGLGAFFFVFFTFRNKFQK